MIYHGYGSVGFAFLDINGDGVDELVVGDLDDKKGKIISLYYRSGDTVQLAINARERDHYILCTDGLISNMGSSGAEDTVTATYELGPTGIVEVTDGREKDFFNITDANIIDYESLGYYFIG